MVTVLPMEVSKMNELDPVEKDQLNQEDLEIVAGGTGEEEASGDEAPIRVKGG